MKSLRMGLPPWPYLRQLYMSFIKLIDLNYADINFIPGGLEIEAKGPDVRAVLRKAFNYAAGLGSDHAQRGFRNPFPLSGNDAKASGPLAKLLRELGLPGNISMIELLSKYGDLLSNIQPEDLQNALYPYTAQGNLAPLQVLLLEFYSLTRGPFFDGTYKLELRMNAHQMLVCIAGYIAARHMRIRVDNKNAAVLMLPMSLNITRYDFFRNLRNTIGMLPGLRPEEAVVLWIALKVPDDFPEDIMVLALEEPAGPNQASPMASIPVYVTELRARAGKALERLRGMSEVYDLLKTALSKGTGRAGSRPEVDDAGEYVKLLFLALQGFEREKLELELRAARREAATSLSASEQEERRRHDVARKARIIAQRLTV